MKRRDVLVSAGAATAAGLLGGFLAGCGSAPLTGGSGLASGALRETSMEPENELQLAVANCLAAGNACLAHCLRLLGQGDTSVAECAKRVVVMLPVCEAVGTLVDNGSRHVASIAALCSDVCEDCAAACEPHAPHHAACRECLEACRRVSATAVRVVSA